MVDNINSLPLNVQDNTDVAFEDNDSILSSKATENEAINLFQRDILVFDKDETLIHIISADDYNDDVYKRQINKEWSFSFTVDVSLSDVIIRKNKIGVYDREGRLQLFIIEDITERYSKTPTMEVYCIHDSFILNDTVLEEFAVTDTIDNVLDSVLAGTSYQRGYTDKFDVADVDMQLTSRFGGIQTIAETFGGELDFRFTLDETRTRILNRYVDVKFSLGRDIGVRFTFDTNLTEVVRTVTSDNHFTVLYGLGRSLATGATKPDGSKEYKRVDFSDVAWGESTGNPTNKPVGQRYIEDAEGIEKWGRIEGIYINETITDPETLINRTWKQLQKCKEPSFSYSVTVEDLSRLAGYEHLSVGIGDTVIIKDEDFKLELSARIQEEQYSIKENIIKALDAESVPMPMSARAITGLSSHGGGNKKLVLGVLQRSFTEDSSGSGTVSPPTVDTGSGDVNVDNENFPDVLPATPIISGTGLFATIMTSWTFENSIYYGYELHGSQVENFITSQNTILARGKISSHLHQCKPGERWYFKVRAYNTHGNYTPFSNEIALESSKVADGAEWFENAAIGDALIGQLRLDRGWVGRLTGELIEARNLKVINDNNVDTLHIDNAGNVSLNVSSFSLVQGATSNVPTKNEMTNEINNIEIGGRNLIIRHTETKNTYIDTSGNIVNQNGYATSDYIELVPGGIMAFSKETVSSNDEYFRWAWYDSNKGYISRKAENSNKFKWNVPSGARYARISYHMDCYPKVERGTKHTEWSPSPEDVEYNIKNVSDNLESFENTVTGSFKDGIIQEAEAKAIAQQLTVIETTRIELIREYNSIYANNNLSGTAKTNLANAKTEFENAHNSLKSTINTVIADGRVTASESASVDSTFATYQSVIGTFKTRLQEAIDYISTKKVDDIIIGGTNLIPNTSNTYKDITVSQWSGEVTNRVHCSAYGLKPGDTVTFSVIIKPTTKTSLIARVDFYSEASGDTGKTINLGNQGIAKGSEGVSYVTATIPSGKEYLWLAIQNQNSSTETTTTIEQIKCAQLEKGNKPTDWSPAPEDMESAYTIVLSNEAQTIATSNTGYPLTTTAYSTDIQVYKGTTQRTDFTIGNLTSANGITISKVSSSQVQLSVSTGTQITANTGGFTIPITIDGKTFNKVFSWSVSKQGNTGATGANGISINSVDVEYYLSTSATSLTGGSWSTTAPTWVNGKYMWSRTKTTLSTGTVTYSQAACITGQAGATGSTGATGTGVSSITEEYYLSTSKTTQVDGSWTTTPPTWKTGTYLWTRSKIVYSNPTSTAYTTPICDSSWEAVNSVTVGGTNMLLNSDFSKTVQWGTNANTTYTTNGRNGKMAMTIQRSDWNGTSGRVGATSYGTTIKEVIPKGTSFTLSAWVYIDDSVPLEDNSSSIFLRLQRTDDNSNYDVCNVKITKDLPKNTWIKLEHSNITAYESKPFIDGNTSSPHVGLYLSRNGKFRVSDVKLEYGNKATDWTPAPEDVKEDLNSTVTKVDVMYYLSTSNTTLTGGSWSTTAPTWVDGKYMWSKTVTTLKSGKTIESNPTCIAGATGASGSDGKGIKTIVEQYYHSTSMSSLAGGSWSTTAPTPVVGKYIWTRSVITYTDDTTTTTSPICTTGATGAAGANAKTLDLTATSLMFTSQDGGISWTPSNGIVITATCKNTSVAKWWISPNNGSTWEELTANGTNQTLTIQRSSFTSRNATSLLVKCVATDSTVFDTITIGQIIGYDESKIGNRNLAQKTSSEWETHSNFSDKNNECILPHDILLKDLVIGDTINFYFKMKFENVVKGTNHTTGTIYLQGSGDVTGWSEGAIVAKHVTIPSGGTGEVIVTHSIKVDAPILKNNKWNANFRCDYIKSGAISIKCLMVVNGKLPTAWVPAPEDMIEYVDSSMQSMLASNNDIMDKIYLITSDNYISEAERADFKVTYEQITSQYDTMCWTIDKMNVEYLNTYKTDLTSKYNVVVSVCKPIVENNLDTGAINVRNAIVDFFSSYNNALFAVSTYTKDQLTSISLRVETLNNEFKVSSVRADDAYNATLEMGKHMKFSENWLELYGTVNGASSQFKARLSNEALEFYDGDDVVASISNKKLNIANAEIKHSLTVGKFSISPSAREAGGVVFKYNS